MDGKFAALIMLTVEGKREASAFSTPDSITKKLVQV